MNGRQCNDHLQSKAVNSINVLGNHWTGSLGIAFLNVHMYPACQGHLGCQVNP